MKILINGKSGFVGSNVYVYLKEKKYDIDYFSFKANNNLKNISSEVSSVIHLAGKAHDLKKVSDPQEYYEVNLELTKRIFDDFLSSNATVFITLSSAKAVADTFDGILTENIKPKPVTHYGKSKLLAEEYIFSKDLPSNKKVYVLRPCMIHGKGNKGNLNLLYNLIKKNLPYPLARFENKRSYLTMENLCFVINELLTRIDIPSGVYNISDTHPISTTKLVEIIKQETNSKTRIWKPYKKLIQTIAKIGDVFPFVINSEKLEKLIGNYIVSNEKLLKALKKDLPVSTEDGLKQTLKSFENGK